MVIKKQQTIEFVLRFNEAEAKALHQICIDTVKYYMKKNDYGPRTDEENTALDIISQLDELKCFDDGM